MAYKSHTDLQVLHDALQKATGALQAGVLLQLPFSTIFDYLQVRAVHAALPAGRAALMLGVLP